MTPAPEQPLRFRPSVRFHRTNSSEQPQIQKLKAEKDEKIYFRQQGLSQVPQLVTNLNFLETPAGGQARASRLIYTGTKIRTVSCS